MLFQILRVARRATPAVLGLLSFACVAAAGAQEPGAELQPATETSRYVFDSTLLIVSAFAVMAMSMGLALREAGLARMEQPLVPLKCLAVAAVAAAMTWLCGSGLASGVEPGGFLGDFVWWTAGDEAPGGGRAPGAIFLLQAALAAAGAMIVSGAVAERMKMWPFMVFAGVFAGLIYPVASSWAWGGGVLQQRGFVDYAGATILHSAAGWAALSGALLIGPRYLRQDSARFDAARPIDPGLAACGAVLIWFGVYGAVAGASAGLASVAAATAIAAALVNAALAASAGVLAAMIMTQIVYRRIDAAATINGAVGALAAISAEPFAPALWQAAVIGAFSGAIVTVGAPLLARARIDDVAGAIPAHLFCGVWGTLIVPWTKESASYVEQIIGIAMIGGFSSVMAFLAWTLLKYTVGLRLAAQTEFREHGSASSPPPFPGGKVNPR